MISGAAILAKHQPLPRRLAPGQGLVVRDVSVRFGAVQALSNISFNVPPGEIFGVAGPNGAGKSTLIGVCTGQVRPDRGIIELDGGALKGRPHAFCHAGVARMFQVPQIFSSMTVRENVETGLIFGNRDSSDTNGVDDLLEMTGLTSQASEAASSLDLLARKRVMLAAALATGPRVLFMDEPLGGLNEIEIDAFSSLIRKVRDEMALSIVLVEHKIRALAQLSQRIMILNFGETLRIDTPGLILSDPEIITLYLGKKHEY
ncbi:ABC transporter ATP-binding protein [Sulfitobacter dubius]|nr:ATP-binding cassette domain-containing protein [Sulfitobacter dubius]